MNILENHFETDRRTAGLRIVSFLQRGLVLLLLNRIFFLWGLFLPLLNRIFLERGLILSFLYRVRDSFRVISRDQRLRVIFGNLLHHLEHTCRFGDTRQSQIVLENLELLWQIERLISLGIFNIEQRYLLPGDPEKNILQFIDLLVGRKVEPRLSLARSLTCAKRHPTQMREVLLVLIIRLRVEKAGHLIKLAYSG